MGDHMNAKLEQYRVFCSVAEQGSISAAARQLYLSQSAVSQDIRSLEESLGTRLFTRMPRGVSLTSDGQTLYDYVSRALGLLEAGEKQLADTRELMTGEISIGANDTLTKYYLLPFLQRYHREYPGVRIRICNGTSRRVLEMLETGQVDLAFATAPEEGHSFDMQPCFETHTAFVAAPDYDCDFDKAYSLEELGRFPLILLDRTASSRRYLEQRFLAAGLTLKPEIELSSHNLLIAIARIGLGVACVTEEMALSGLQRGIIRKLRTAEDIPARQVVLCALRSASLSAAAQRFREIVVGAEQV